MLLLYVVIYTAWAAAMCVPCNLCLHLLQGADLWHLARPCLAEESSTREDHVLRDLMKIQILGQG